MLLIHHFLGILVMVIASVEVHSHIIKYALANRRHFLQFCDAIILQTADQLPAFPDPDPEPWSKFLRDESFTDGC